MTTTYRTSTPKESGDLRRKLPPSTHAETNPPQSGNAPESEKLMDRFAHVLQRGAAGVVNPVDRV
jgi:hypothetical protein